jgi:hypothetical protein
LIGGIAETQEMLDFCAEKGIVSDIEMIAMQDIEKAYVRLLNNDVKYRFVIDMATLKPAAKACQRRAELANASSIAGSHVHLMPGGQCQALGVASTAPGAA